MEEKQTLSLRLALLPVLILIALLALNVQIFGDAALDGSNQFLLLVGGAVAIGVGLFKKVPFATMLDNVASNIQSTVGALLILLFVGALSGAWLVGGIIPSMIYYGLKILNPSFFLPATVLICAIISIATGSSWTTSATVGIALVAIGNSLGFHTGMVAGAVISGAYFGDKMSPLSDTTNLAPAMAGTDLFTHIRYMALTTVPTLIITLILFILLGLSSDSNGSADTATTLADIEKSFTITPWVFIVPAIVIYLIVKKTPPLVALFTGSILGIVSALVFQPQVLASIGGGSSLDWNNAYKGVLNALTISVEVPSENAQLAELFQSGGMSGMLGTIWLIICAMVFGGVMEAIGALNTISASLLSLAKSTFGLFASTVGSCVTINFTASDQYLAIVVPGKMFAKAYEDKGLAPENLSRTLEDSGTVTSVLVPWNTCGAYQSNVLGVDTWAYVPYAFFNYISPFMTLAFAAFGIKIKKIANHVIQ